MTRRLSINLNVLGVGQRPAAWRSSDLHAESIVDPEHWQLVGRLAEQGTLDALFLADHPGLADPRARPLQFLEPSVLLATIAAGTTHLGLVGTASTTLNDPYELATRLLTLDTLSGGRYAWNAVTTYDDASVRNYGLEHAPSRPVRYARAQEFVAAVTALWRSAETGTAAEFDGEYVSVSGTLRVPPSAQGHPVIVQAGGSADGQRLAAAHADAVYSIEQTIDTAVRNRATVRALAEARGRGADSVRIFPGLAIVIGSTEEEAYHRFDHWENLAPPTYSVQALSYALGTDASAFDLDAPLPDAVLDETPDPETFPGSIGYRNTLVALARQDRPTVRRLLREFGGYGQRFIAGTPETIADSMEEWFRAGAADGFNIMVDLFPSGLIDFVEQVVPLLRKKGIFRHEYAETTLRERFANP